MERESHDATVIHSSIALLQERFRQLQRVKEMREEREILRMLALCDSEPKHKQLMMMNTSNPIPTVHNKPAAERLFFHPDHHDLIQPHGHGSSESGISLSLWPALQSNHEDYILYRSIETPLLINLWPSVRDTPSLDTYSNKFQGSDCDSDVDTSLHLLPDDD
ncbi:hypothetical protein ACE6H2_012833 [Prunus campanulata]